MEGEEACLVNCGRRRTTTDDKGQMDDGPKLLCTELSSWNHGNREYYINQGLLAIQ